jgi:hypothetical protein
MMSALFSRRFTAAYPALKCGHFRGVRSADSMASYFMLSVIERFDF